MTSSIFTRLFLALALSLTLLWPVPVGANELTDELRQQIQGATVTVRGLEPLGDVPIEFTTPDQLRVYLLEALNDQEAIDNLAIAVKINTILGLISPEVDLHQALVELLSGSVVGQYRFKEKRMYLIAPGGQPFGADGKVTLAHEYTHALQDQHFDLEGMNKAVKDHDDQSLALRALIEGDATLSEWLFIRDNLSFEELGEFLTPKGEGAMSAFQKAPFVLQEELRFPYVEGFTFVIQLWQVGGFPRIDEAFRQPPTSTEQIIHPDKFLDGEAPIGVSLPDLVAALGSGWKQSYANVMGELELRILIENFTDASMAARAAAGWGGDAYALLEHVDGRTAWVMDSVWDTESDAGEFFNAFGFGVLRRFGTRANRVVDEPSRTIWQTPGGAVGVTKWADRVGVVYAPDPDFVEMGLAALAPDAALPRVPVPAVP